MQVCKYASMQVCKYASMQVRKYASTQVRKYASIEVWRYGGMHVCTYSYMHVCIITNNNNSPHNKNIHVGSHSLDTDRRNNWHTDEHTDSVTNILLTSFKPMSSRQHMSESKEDHTTCPQAMHMKRKMRMYSEVVAGCKPVKTSNRFSPLTQMSGNW